MSHRTPIGGCLLLFIRRCFECQPILETARGSKYAVPKRLNIHIFINDQCAKAKDIFSSGTAVLQTFPAFRPDRARCVNATVDWLDICEEVGGALGRRQKGEENENLSLNPTHWLSGLRRWEG